MDNNAICQQPTDTMTKPPNCLNGYYFPKEVNMNIKVRALILTFDVVAVLT